MATIDIQRTHGLGVDVARQKAETLANGMRDKLGIEWRWQGDAIRFDAPTGMAKGTKGQVQVTATSIRVEIDLPLLLRPARSAVEAKIHAKLDAALAG